LTFIKRVVALPGETVRVVGGRVFLDGEPLDEPHVVYRDADDMPPTTVPPDAYFVLGDNRPESSDSRLGGPVPAGHIVGQARLSYWPPTSWGAVPAEAARRPAAQGSAGDESETPTETSTDFAVR